MILFLSLRVGIYTGHIQVLQTDIFPLWDIIHHWAAQHCHFTTEWFHKFLCSHNLETLSKGQGQTVQFSDVITIPYSKEIGTSAFEHKLMLTLCRV